MPTRHSPEQPTVIINTAAEYDAAQREVRRLADAAAGSVDALTFQAFSSAIEVYEARRHRDDNLASQPSSGTASDE